MEEVLEFGDASNDEDYGEPITTGIDFKDWIDIILIVLILMFLSILVYGIVIYNSDGVSCLSDPIGYLEGIKNISLECKEISFDNSPIDFTKINIVNP